MCYSDDPIRDFEMHDAKRQAELERCPVCEHCKEHIQEDEYYEIDGSIVCDDCLLDFVRKNCKKTIN